MQNRRQFLKHLALGGGLLAVGQFPFEAMAQRYTRKLTILHTNDVHSRLEPFPDNDKNFAGLGGVARRAELIKRIRKEERDVLLFDCGDYFQGTPYFNLYQGEPEIKAMNMMGYDAATIGNHEFDLGIDNLATQLRKAKFDVLNANYDFERTPMKGIAQPFKIYNKAGLKIGVFGLGVQLYGLVPPEAYGKTWHHDAIEKGVETSFTLKKRFNCDFVICLSHLGYEYNSEKASDVRLAKASEHIDLILGGHSHTFMETPEVVENKNGVPVVINQVGWGGVRLGRLDYYFTKEKEYFSPNSNTVIIGK